MKPGVVRINDGEYKWKVYSKDGSTPALYKQLPAKYKDHSAWHARKAEIAAKNVRSAWSGEGRRRSGRNRSASADLPGWTQHLDDEMELYWEHESGQR